MDNSLVSYESIYRKMLKLKSVVDVLAEQVLQRFPQATQSREFEEA